jgi:hypothetical protein
MTITSIMIVVRKHNSNEIFFKSLNISMKKVGKTRSDSKSVRTMTSRI